MPQEFKLLHRGDFTIFPKQIWFRPRDHVGEIKLLDGFSRDIASAWLNEDYHISSVPCYYAIYDFEGPIDIEEWQILSRLKDNGILKFSGFEEIFLVCSACLCHPETVRIEKKAPYVWQLLSEDPTEILRATEQNVVMYFCDNMLVGSLHFFEEEAVRYMGLCLPGDNFSENFRAKKRRFIVKR